MKKNISEKKKSLINPLLGSKVGDHQTWLENSEKSPGGICTKESAVLHRCPKLLQIFQKRDTSDKSLCRNLIDPESTDGRKNQFQLIRSVFILLGIEEKLMTSNWFMGSKVVDHQSPIKNAKAGQSLKVEKQLFTRFCWQIEGIPAKDPEAGEDMLADIFADTFLQRTLSSGSEMRKKTFQKNVENVWRKYWVPSNIRVYEVHFRNLPK